MYKELAGESTIYEFAQSENYPIEKVLDVAILATSRDPSRLPELVVFLDDPHPVIRYWAVTGCLVLKEESRPLRQKLRPLLEDPVADVRVVAAEVLGNLGEVEAATTVLVDVLKTGNEYEALAAITVLELFARSELLPVERVKDLTAGTQGADAQRVLDWIQSLN